MRWFLILLISAAYRLTAGYNYLIVSPLFGHSHSHFMGTIADTLTEAGHNVTVLMPIMDPDLENNTGLKSTTHVIKVAPDNRTAAMFMQKARFSSRLWNLEPSAFGMIKLAMHLAQSFSWQCESEHIRAAQNKIHNCGYFMCPRRSCLEDCWSASCSQLCSRAQIYAMIAQKALVQELLAQVSYVFTNSNPYLDYPHPTIHKAIDIGGIANIDEILNVRKTNVVISFGSIVKSCYMPEDYKESLLKVFESMPNTTFIWKYELEESPIVAHLPNVHLFAWIPQNALLADPRISAFVSHGGLGSTNEIAHMGKPAVMVPLFADQSRNANMLAKHGGALVLEKYDIANHTKVAEAIQKITSDQRFVDHGKFLIFHV
ncbi:UDP-glucoronosyl and UDP-glucosyl transferase [Ancylostoma ceylanicum]|uniref:glucuronosyltransferase n=1 Tax=Ancylostoma ceylanicum TaxID=53326 RepID=A0A0D6L933_9BILA|nr:UDP-glucoronosyl and UDP-glucosyl transferase [Ancylostoma ceylanicum]